MVVVALFAGGLFVTEDEVKVVNSESTTKEKNIYGNSPVPLYVIQVPYNNAKVLANTPEDSFSKPGTVTEMPSTCQIPISYSLEVSRKGGSTCERKCGSSESCVTASMWCDGIPQCPNKADEMNCGTDIIYVRLYGPSSELQAYSPQRSAWLPVCSDYWSDTYGRSTCQEIGYNQSSYVRSDHLVRSSSPVGFLKLNMAATGKMYQRFYYSSTCSVSKVVSLRCIDCGYSTNVDSRIVGGRAASSGDWPWQVKLVHSTNILCGGSIVTPYWVVSAAHCVIGRTVSGWRVFAGYLTVNYNTDKSYSLERILIRSDYDQYTQNNDISLMKLKEKLSFTSTIRPVCLPNPGMLWQAGQSCWISGWGATSETGYVSSNLMEVSVPLIASTTCNQAAVYNGAITSSMICAGYLAGGKDSCQGDSGGPLVTKTNNQWWLVGDTSWGYGCARANKPGVYGNMTVFVDWIYLVMQVTNMH
ncbi:transmembrane protease serine 2 [Rhinophrynus dorsalis]